MKRTGELLKKAREQKGLSISEIGLSLKISSKILKAIEDGNLNQLPAKTFLRGFVQSYANYLRLDVNEILRIFQDEMGSTRPSPLIQMPERDETLETSDKIQPVSNPTKSNPSSEKPLNSLAKSHSSRTVSLSILCVVLVGAIIFAKKMIDKYQKEGTISEVEVTTPLPTSTESNPSATPMAIAAMSTPLPTPTLTNMTPAPTPLAKATPIPTPTPNPSVMPSPTATPKPSPTPSPTPTPTPTPTPKPTATPTPSPTPTATPTPSPSPSPAMNKPVEVIVEALDAVEVEITTKDGKSEKISLTAEQIHTFKSKNGLKLNISNGGAVNVIVNGKDLGIPGNLGKPVKLNY
jgi:cytoskeleton protein RodZ